MSATSAPLRLHLGCGTVTPAGWVNVDAALGARLARLGPLRGLLRALGVFRLDWPPGITIHDLRRPFPWADGAAEAIYSSHTLEHLARRDGERFLRECARVLAPQGVLRIVVPDLAALIDGYEKREFPATELVERMGVLTEHPDDGWLKRRLAPLFRFPHRCMYDAESLLAILRDAGLDARAHAPMVSRIADIADIELPERAEGSLIVEAVKPPRGARAASEHPG